MRIRDYGLVDTFANVVFSESKGWHYEGLITISTRALPLVCIYMDNLSGKANKTFRDSSFVSANLLFFVTVGL